MERTLQKYADIRLAKLDNGASLAALRQEWRSTCAPVVQPVEKERKTRRTWVAALSSATALFLIAAIVLGVYFLQKPAAMEPDTALIGSSDAEGFAYASGETYGDLRMTMWHVNYGIGEELYNDALFPFYYGELPIVRANGGLYPTHWDMKTLPVYDIEKAGVSDITYITDNRTNGVVMTKWMFFYFYRYSVLSGYGANGSVLQEGIGNLSGQKAYQARYACFTDEYCMEKVCMDVLSLVRPDEGKSLRDYNEEELAEANEKMGSMDNDVCYAYFQPYLVSPITSNRSELYMASLARYGAFDPSDPISGVRGLYVTVRDEQGYKYSRTLRIVGYIETEADKHLSTGVSMDETSEAYQTVLRQLQNPAVYSVDGNVMAAR